MSSSLPPRRRSTPTAGFRPTLSLTLAYLALFFLAFALALVLPALWPLLRSSAPGPELQQLAQETARSALRPRIGFAFGLAVLATTLGVWLRVLPGLSKA